MHFKPLNMPRESDQETTSKAEHAETTRDFPHDQTQEWGTTNDYLQTI